MILNIPYYVERAFAVYNNVKECIGTFDKITDGLGPFLSNLLKYNIELANKENRLITPPPAYFFYRSTWTRIVGIIHFPLLLV